MKKPDSVLHIKSEQVVQSAKMADIMNSNEMMLSSRDFKESVVPRPGIRRIHSSPILSKLFYVGLYLIR